jgi:putative hydrolase of the HAD superfamily
MIKAVVFDFGGVISFAPGREVMEELASMAGGVDLKVMETLLWKYRDEYDRGTLAARDYYEFFLSKAGVHPDGETIEKMIQIDLDSWKHINPATVKLMEDVKDRAYKVGVLSNMPWDFLEFARKNFSFFKLLDAGIFSCEIGAIKPEKDIYDALISALDCAYEEVVFFDDISRNIEQAQNLGIRAFLWKDPKTAGDELKALGLSI